MIRPDLMKVLLISRGPKLNRRERRENWIKKRAASRRANFQPPLPPPVPLRMVNRKYACDCACKACLFTRLSIATQIALEITSSF